MASGCRRSGGSTAIAATTAYLGSDEAVAQACERAGVTPVEPANPYWQQHGVTLSDPDGFRGVLVPGSWADADHGPTRVND
jgi:hypothetical protein